MATNDSVPRRLFGLALVCVAVSACGGLADEADGEEVEEVIGGTVTYARPEIGTITGGCTATLIAPRVLLTAAHCFNYQTRTNQSDWGNFFVQRSATSRFFYRIEQFQSFGSRLGPEDIALVRLVTAVPPEVARPASLASVTPADGVRLSIYGYGCTARGTYSDGLKRRYDFLQGAATSNICPGDSGGPVINRSTGRIVAVNSGYYTRATASDVFAYVPALHDALTALTARWSSAAFTSAVDAGTDGGARDAGYAYGDAAADARYYGDAGADARYATDARPDAR